MDTGIRNVVLFCLQGEKEIWTNTSHLRKNHNGHFCWSFLKRAGTQITFLLEIKQWHECSLQHITIVRITDLLFSPISTVALIILRVIHLMTSFWNLYMYIYCILNEFFSQNWDTDILQLSFFFQKKKTKQKELLDATLSQHTCGTGTQN